MIMLKNKKKTEKKVTFNLETVANSINVINQDLRQNLGIQLLYTGMMMDKYIDAEVRKYGQNRSRLDILHTLITHGGVMKPSDLGKLLYRSKQTITQTVDGLEKEGLVEREKTNLDRRTKRIIITQKGIDAVGSNLPATTKIAQGVLPELDKEDAAKLTTLLKAIRKHLREKITK